MDIYENLIKKIKLFVLIGELAIFILRLLVQRIFSLYVGLVMLQLLVCGIINFRRSCQTQCKFYILFNMVLIYILSINLVQVFSNNKQLFQNLYKDNFIINYVQLGYPLEFAFRFISLLIVWRLFQYSRFKSFNNGQPLPIEQPEVTSPRRQQIRIRRSSFDVQSNNRNFINQNQQQMIRNSPNRVRYVPQRNIQNNQINFMRIQTPRNQRQNLNLRQQINRSPQTNRTNQMNSPHQPNRLNQVNQMYHNHNNIINNSIFRNRM